MAECVAAIWKMMHAFSYAMDVWVVNLFVNASRHGKLTLISAKRSSSSSSWPKYLYSRSRAVEQRSATSAGHIHGELACNIATRALDCVLTAPVQVRALLRVVVRILAVRL